MLLTRWTILSLSLRLGCSMADTLASNLHNLQYWYASRLWSGSMLKHQNVPAYLSHSVFQPYVVSLSRLSVEKLCEAHPAADGVCAALFKIGGKFQLCHTAHLCVHSHKEHAWTGAYACAAWQLMIWLVITLPCSCIMHQTPKLFFLHYQFCVE